MTTQQNGTAESPVKQALREIRRLKAELEAERTRRTEPIAIVGMGLRLPGGVDSPDRYWDLLANGVEAVGPIPRERWNHDEYFDEDAETPGKYYIQRGGFLSNVDGFDPEFFGISPLEAITMDPQQRLLLETVWEALEHAGIPATSLHGTRTGVFVGIGATDYHRIVMSDRAVETYGSTGTLFSVAAGRISYVLGLTGPAIAIDTACSSSLVAVHLACRSLRERESDTALAAGVSLMLTPDLTVNFCRAGMLSRDGRCKTFDAAGDGYVRSEGAGVVVLKRLSDALRDGDRIHAVIRGSAINQDGRSSGLTAPSGPAQEAVLRAALEDAGVQPTDVDYVEAHGTGTSLGDPIEVQAIGAVYGAGRTQDRPLYIGSVKTNLGHLEAAAGVAGLVKAALSLEHGEIPPHLHFTTPNPHIAWDALPVAVPTRRTTWDVRERPRRAGVSSFGFSGTNAHVVLEEAPASGVTARPADRADLLVLSAPNDDALRALAARYADFLGTTQEAFVDICHASRTGRVHFDERLAIVADSCAGARAALQQWLDDARPESVFRSAPGTKRIPAATVAFDDPAALDAQTIQQLAERSPALKQALANGHAASSPLTLAAVLYVSGVTPVRSPGAAHGRRAVLPTYPFQRRRFWYTPSNVQPTVVSARASADPATAWPVVVEAARERAALAPLDMDVGAYGRAWAALNRLTVVLGRNTLAELEAFAQPGVERTLDDVLSMTGIKPSYRRIVGRWLDFLVEDRMLERTANGYVARKPLLPIDAMPAWRDAEAALQSDQPLLEYVRHSGSMITDVLSGRTSALESLFPDGSFELAERLYHRSTLLRYVNGIAAVAASTYADRVAADRTLRVLEVGAGTGGTTAPLLRALPQDRTTYTYTDVSDIFLDFAATRFGDTPFLRTALFDLEKEPEGQGFAAGSQDIVVAANVIHAARDIRKAVERVKRLLAPGGMLLLVESTGHHPWHDITTGLIEGWQHFEDDLRTDTPLLTPQQWNTLLSEAGFEDVAALPTAGSPAEILKQHVLIARAPAAAATATVASTTQSAPVTPPERRQVHVAPSPAPVTGAQEASEVVRQIAQAPAEEREEIAASLVRDVVMAVLRSDPNRPPSRDARLLDLGLDSLMAVRLRNQLQKKLGLREALPSTLVFDYPTIRHIAKLIVKRAVPDQPVVPEQPTAAEAAPPDLASMSDAEVEAMLLKRLESEASA